LIQTHCAEEEQQSTQQGTPRNSQLGLVDVLKRAQRIMHDTWDIPCFGRIPISKLV